MKDTTKQKDEVGVSRWMYVLGAAAVGGAVLYAPTNITNVVTLDESFEDTLETRQQTKMAETFYNIATDFYEWGWSQSFHFAPRWSSETFEQSLVRHEHGLAQHLDLRAGMECMDLGCGVAGPLRNIVRFSRAHVTGLTITNYQVGVGNRKIREAGLSHLAKVVHGNYHEQPFENNTFDRGYDFEASLHSDNLPLYYREVFRTLKPGGRFAGFAYVWSDDFNPENNTAHAEIRDDYRIGNGCAHLYKWAEWEQAMVDSGLKLEYHMDLAGTTDIDWFAQLQPSYDTLSGFAATPFGMRVTSYVTWTMETLGLAPEGTYNAHELLVRGGRSLKVGGELGLITPMHLYVLSKPLE